MPDTKVLDVVEMARWIQSTRTPMRRGAMRAMLEATNYAYNKAKQYAMHLGALQGNAAKFNPSERTRTGRLVNSIIMGFDREAAEGLYLDRAGVYKPVGWVGVAMPTGKGYGAIHEYGGIIKPVKAKNLWIPFSPLAKKLTPTQFMEMMRRKPRGAFIKDGMALMADGPIIKGKKPSWQVVYLLLKEVRIPARPYVTPAVDEANKMLPDFLKKRVEEALAEGGV